MTNSRMPKRVSSRPYPECFTPPKGRRTSERTFWFTKLIPASSRIRRKPLAAREIAGENARAEAELAVVGDADRLRLVGGLDHGCDRTEDLLVIDGHAWPHVGQNGRRIPCARLVGDHPSGQQAGAGVEAALHLVVHAIAVGDADQRTELGVVATRIAHDEGRHLARQRLFERLADRRQHDETLARDAALAGVHHPRLGRHLGRRANVGVVENEIGVAAAEFQDALLQHGAGLRRDLATGLDAAGQADGGDHGILDQGLHAGGGDQHSAEHVGREAGSLEHLFDGQRRARNVGRVLEEPGIAGHQGRCGEAEDLPEREIPRHHRQHRAEGAIDDLGALGAGKLEILLGEVGAGMVGEPIAGRRALFHLGATVGEDLAHLGAHQLGQMVLAIAQDLACGAHQAGALLEGGLGPAFEGRSGGSRDLPGLLRRVTLVPLAGFARGRIDGLEGRAFGHVKSPETRTWVARRSASSSTTISAREGSSARSQRVRRS
ncbi:hypothetical protein LRS10_17075 [Phenylobacterium sp. J426]|nr:hypothetical protein [Phenylobacterium sp. J426]MCR5875727.1 hypothetical protein [Phenylobacterium sp. J426]